VDIDRFLISLEDSSKTKADLLAMRDNALGKRATKHAALAERVLDKRFPMWRTPRGGGGRPTEVSFRGHKKQFHNEKEAYFWLIERFIQHNPAPFAAIDWEREFAAKGARTSYFSKSLEGLFKNAPNHASDPNKYYLLKNGWYAKAQLTEKQKVELLFKFARLAQLKFGGDWDWNELAVKSPHQTVEELLQTLSTVLRRAT
jgi:hypothetical protein